MALDEEPPFWWTRPGAMAFLLSPISFVWGQAVGYNMARSPAASAPVPVLCIGNFIAGGAGKTPTAIAFANAVRKAGHVPGFLSRGYGGQLEGPLVVDLQKHRAVDVGDEPLLLAEEQTTVISGNRPAGAELLAANGCDFIIMDDGFQNPSLEKDFSLVVVDAQRGLGNGFAIPAGPLRAPLRRQLPHADAVLVIGAAVGGDEVIRQAARHGKPTHMAHVRPLRKREWKGQRVFAYAGIADPSKLFDTLDAVGADIVGKRGFADHHFYTEEEAEELLRLAKESEAVPVTTSKDMARLRSAGSAQDALAAASKVMEVKLEFEDPRAAAMIVDVTARNAQSRLVRSRTTH